MNIQDIETDNSIDDWEKVFSRQKELMKKYHVIEESNGFYVGGDLLDLDNAKDQYRIKDFLWRTTEELAESMEAYPHHIEHALEEVADSLHFLTELFLSVGLDHRHVPEADSHNTTDASDHYISVVAYLGLAGNCLKNKPWKQSQMKTDAELFQSNLIKAYREILELFYSLGCEEEQEIFDLYFRKSEVNKFRQRSNY